MVRFLSIVLAVLVGLVVGAGCDRSAPVAAVGAGAEGTGGGDEARARVVVLSPGLAVTMRDLGLGELLVGRHGFDAWSDPGLPVCGDQSGIDYERLLAVRPTHILVQWGQRELPARLTEMAGRHGWEVRSMNPLSLEEVRSAAADLVAMFGAGEEGEEALAAFDGALRRREGVDLSRAGRVMLLDAVSPPGVIGPGSYHDDVLRRIGGTPAVTQGAAYIVMDAEDVLALRPDAIVVLLPRPPRSGGAGEAGPGGASRTGVLPREEWASVLGALARLNIPAVTRGRVALIDDPECLLPATSLGRFAEDLARILEGWAMEEEAAGEPRGAGAAGRSSP